jgi:hypothetical protein
MQVDVRPLRSSASDVEVPPPIGVGGEGIAWVLVQAVVVFVPEEPDHHSGNEYQRPIGTEDGEESAGQHVEFEAGFEGELRWDGRAKQREWLRGCRLYALPCLAYRVTAHPPFRLRAL